MKTRNDGRQALIEAAIDSIAVHGVARTHPKDLTDALGLSKSLVNFHFDGRDGLMAEAIATAFERHVDGLSLAVLSAGPDPMARLIAWIDAFLTWSATHPGLMAATAFPDVTPGTDGVHDGSATRFTAATLARWDGLCGLILEAVGTAGGRSTVGPNASSDIVDDPGITVWWFLQGAAVSAASRPDQLEMIRETVLSRLPALLAS